jgi:C_GCAxxG_C_C family probable redox protein
MKDNVNNAVEIYKDGYNCAQSVLTVFAPDLGMDRDIAMKVSCGFGSGIGRSGNLCGAITGGMLVLGLKYGMIDSEFQEEKENTYDKVIELQERIRAIHGTVNCNDLLGFDIGTPEGLEKVKELELSDKICSKIVGDVVRILEELL